MQDILSQSLMSTRKARLAETLGITRQGALYVISTLERAGIVAEEAGSERSTLYLAREVLDVLEDESLAQA